jgi:hypothetical protein
MPKLTACRIPAPCRRTCVRGSPSRGSAFGAKDCTLGAPRYPRPLTEV